MKNLKKKLSKKGGFTLVEMLIVVAIIAILIAVSIPLVNTSLEKARESTDQANLRSAKAEGTIAYLSEVTIGGTKVGSTTADYYYDAINGQLLAPGANRPTAYGKGTTIDGGIDPEPATDRTNQVIIVTITDDGSVTAKWA